MTNASDPAVIKDIDLNALQQLMLQQKYLIVFIVLVTSLLGVALALALPNVYKSSALLAPLSESQGSLSGMAQQYSGLASVVGISLPGGSEVTDSEINVRSLSTRQFVLEFINKYKIAESLMTGVEWRFIQEAAEDEFNCTSFNERNIEYSSGLTTYSASEVLEKFFAVYNVTEDKNSGFITVSLNNRNPQTAAFLLNCLIAEANSRAKERDQQEAAQSISYLEEKIRQNSFSDVDQVLSELVQAKIQQAMLAEIRTDYAFMVLDPPLAMSTPDSPNRILIIFIFSAFGLFIAFAIVLIKSDLREAGVLLT